MSRETMNCDNCRVLLEPYIGGDLDDTQEREVAWHLASCDECAAGHADMRRLTADLRLLGDSYVPGSTFVVPSASARSRVPSGRLWQSVAAAAAVVAVVSTSALSIPAFAEQLPLPISREVAELRQERDALERRTGELTDQVERLEVRLKNIGGVQVPVVDTAPEPLPAETNDAIQRLAMDFIKAQYSRDTDALRRMATDGLVSRMDERPSDYLRQGSVVFAQMTDVSRAEDGGYLVFVRLTDDEFNDSSYQQNLTIIESDGAFLVDSADMDA